MLKLVNVTKDYKVADSKVHALKGVSLCFRENEFVGILGQSGCGKTTLLNIIGGLDHYTEGDLVIDGKSTKHYSDKDWDVYRNHRIGFIFQSYNLIPHQTVLGNVELALTIAGVSKEERIARAKQALERVGLGDELHKRPNQLSGGQMQRVAIARALVNNPSILLADEPTGALDSKTSVEVMNLIREIAGERLVIMVTHNPELAEEYATRIVRLKDGLVESDSLPYSEEEEAAEHVKPAAEEQKAEEAEPVLEQAEEPAAKQGKKNKEKKPRARMGLWTSLALSFRNLLTKKGRTILTSVGGSIGIISVCLVLALSNGFNHYIKKTEEDMLSYYPVEVRESAFDITSAMMSFTTRSEMPKLDELDDKVYIDSFLTGLANGISVTNDISDNYLDYLSKMDKNLYAEIQYSYGTTLVDNLFTDVLTGIPANSKTSGRPERTEYLSLSQLKTQYIADLNTYAEEYASLVPFADFFGNIVNKMPGTDFASNRYGNYVLSQYDVVKGHFPENANEAVLVVGTNNEVSDLTLAQLGLIDEPMFLKLFKLGESNTQEEVAQTDDSKLDFSKVIDKEYVFYSNNEVYVQNGSYDKFAKDSFAFNYKGARTDAEALNISSNEGIRVKITGILRLKQGLTYGCLTNGLNVTETTILNYIAMNQQSDIVSWMKEPANNITKDDIIDKYVERGEIPAAMAPMLKAQEGGEMSICRAPASKLAATYMSEYKVEMPAMGPIALSPITLYNINMSHDSAIRAAGGSTKVTSLSIYATDFDGKEALLKYLDKWNDMCKDGETYNGTELKEGNKVKYTDTVGLLMGMMQTMLNAITYALVAFTAISLVVSSVMIGIITYVSVVERVKEIGVLRSLGARKQDIRNLFNAETFIIGLSAGLIGVVVSYALSFAISAILKPLTGIAGLATLAPVAAIVMVGISIVLTLISGLIPASAAAKKDPVIALRTE